MHVFCHAAVGPPAQLVPWTICGNYVAVNGPPRQSIAAMDGPLFRKCAPTSKPAQGGLEIAAGHRHNEVRNYNCLVKAPCTFVAVVNE